MQKNIIDNHKSYYLPLDPLAGLPGGLGLSVRPPTFFTSLLSAAAAGLVAVADACLLGVRLSVSSVLPELTLAGSDFTPVEDDPEAAGVDEDFPAVIKIALSRQANSFTKK